MIRSGARFGSALLLVVAFQLASSTPSAAILSAGDRAALLALDGATNHVLSTSFGWSGPPGTECTGSWTGVTCLTINGEQRVSLLLLGRHHLLQDLSGSLPTEIGNLTELMQLELTDQHLSGNLPVTLDKLTKVTRLDFRRNSFTGGDSQTSGLAPFMTMKNLTFLNLEGNSVTGSIPAAAGTLTKLTNLELTGNSLTGPIPAEIGQLVALKKLWLDANQLEGEIPSQIGNLTALTELRLGGNALVGTIPASLGSLHSLTLLQLGLCHLSGTLPSTLADLAALEELSLGTNRIGGSFSAIDWSRLSNLKKIFLDNNAFAGAIPAQLFQPSSLAEVHLQGNALTEAVPRTVLTAAGLAVIDLRWNALTADADVAARLDLLSSGEFSRTQTIAPVGLTAVGTDTDSLRLSWTPVAFQDAPGGYLIEVRRLDGTGSLRTVTVPDKAVSASDIGGLEAGGSYELSMRTFSNPHAANPNSIQSGKSNPLVGTPATEDRRGQISLAKAPTALAEGQVLHVAVVRTGGVDGPIHVNVSLVGTGSTPAQVGRDVRLITKSLDWGDQEGGTKDIEISGGFDPVVEPTETVQLKIQATPSRLIATPGTTTLEILDRTVASNVESVVVATNDSGLELTVYTKVETDGTNRDVTGRFTTGTTAGVILSEFAIAAERGIDEFDPVVFPMGDTFVVTWSSDAFKVPISACEIDRKKGGCKKKKTLVIDPTAKEFNAVGDGNTFWLTWRAGSGIQLAQFDRLASVIGARELVTEDGSARNPQVARIGSVGVFIAWSALVPQLEGEIETQRPTLQGRTFAPGTGFGPRLTDLAGADEAEVRAHRLLARGNGEVLLSWIGVTVRDSDSGPAREGPQILLRRLSTSGIPTADRSALGCASCGDVLQSYTIVPGWPAGQCIATWVAIPGAGANDPVARRAELTTCESATSEIQLQLFGPPVRLRGVGVGSQGASLLVLGQRTQGPTLSLRSYRCAGSGACQN